MAVKNLIISDDDIDRRLDNYLISKFKYIPKSKIYNIIRKGEVRINSKRIKPSYKLKKEDLVRIPPYLENNIPESKNISTELIDSNINDQNILFNDNNYIILNKKNNISVHGGSKNYIGLIDVARQKFGENIDLCHRLDKTTSGCLVFGKNKHAVRNFNDALTSNKIKKTYSAILKGSFKGSRKIELEIYKNLNSKSKMSISYFKFNEKLRNTTLVDVELTTGRTHQIRIHASKINHPIIFDKKYGDNVFDKSLNIGNCNIALHSRSITFPNLNDKEIKVSCSPSNDFNKILQNLRWIIYYY